MSSLISELKSEGLTPPDFKNSNMEVLKQVARGRGPLIGDKDNKIFLVIDGLGQNLVKGVASKKQSTREILEKADMSTLSTIFPSFTLSVLSCIDSGQTVSEHGIVGEKVPVKEAGTIVSILSYAPQHNTYSRLDEAYFKYIYPKPRTINALKGGYKFAYVQDEYIINKEYTRTMFGDAESIPYVSLEDMLYQISKLVRRGRHQRIYAYYSMIDHAQHAYSPTSPEVAHVLENTLLSINRILLPALKKSDYNLIMTADHGQKEVRRRSMVDIDADSTTMEYLDMPIWGMGRAPIFSVQPGMEKKFEDDFDRRYGKRAILVDSDEAIRSGIFGGKSVRPRLRYRFGTHMAMPKDDSYFNYTYPGRKSKFRKPRFGHHGGMSRDEMEIPLIIY